MLPLQGFWNSVVFFGSSAGILKWWWRRKQESRIGERGGRTGNGFINLETKREVGRGNVELRDGGDFKRGGRFR